MCNPSAPIPRSSTQQHTDVYGVGAFLLAGTEVLSAGHAQDATRQRPTSPCSNPVDARARA
jgi:hypothetical protein